MNRIFLIGLLQLIVFHSFSQDMTDKRTSQFNVPENHLAIQGYDPVAYFLNGKPVKGKPSISYVYEGILYRFSTPANLELFKTHPNQYEPQYGGWCAYAMGSNGEKVEVDPETYKITNGKLYLFYNSFFNNTLKSWNKDEQKLNKQADVNWTKFY